MGTDLGGGLFTLPWCGAGRIPSPPVPSFWWGAMLRKGWRGVTHPKRILVPLWGSHSGDWGNSCMSPCCFLPCLCLSFPAHPDTSVFPLRCKDSHPCPARPLTLCPEIPRAPGPYLSTHSHSSRCSSSGRDSAVVSSPRWGLAPSAALRSRAQTNSPRHRLGRPGCGGSAMETPREPGAGGGARRCPFRRRGTSRGIPQEGGDSSLHQLLRAFVSARRVDHVAMVMGLHPQYLSSFWKTQYLLLRMDGPLPYHKRHYIAIMAAARHRCSYLVGLHMGEFLQVGGDPAWLRGLHCAPQKLRNLSEINKLLAHRPWLVTKEHIEALLKPGEDSWSLAELVQALVLLTHYHSLASFVFGCGIRPEEEQDVGSSCWTPPPHSDSSPASEDSMGGSGGTDAMQEVEMLMERMKLLQENHLEEEGVTQEEMATRFELEKTESLLVPSSDAVDPSLQSNIRCFLEDPEFGYKDFTRRGEQAPPTFRAQDYTWEDHGYSLMNRLYPDVGQLLDEKFQVVYNLTYNTIAMHCGVDTSMLRRAIWNYVHCVFGIRYDDYDYGEVNQLLERNLKIYIKTVACYPEKTTKQIYTQFWRQFKHSEKVHVNLLLLEARMQAALLYALRAVTRYMT